MELGLLGKVALVCAASKGLGKACAMELAKEGCRVVICARHEDELSKATEEIRAASGADLLPVVADLSKAQDIERFVQAAIERFGTVHILVTNVGHPKMGNFLDYDEEAWQEGFKSILMPVVRLCRLVIPHMQRQKWGRIIHITSIAVKEPGSPYLLSSVFRAAVASLGKCLSREFACDNILVHTVCPGPFRTPLQEELVRGLAEQQGKTIDEVEAEMASETPLGRIGEPEELAALVTFICSERASDMTGTTIQVDGGIVRGLL